MRLRKWHGSASVTRGLLRCGVVAGPLFVTTFLVAGATRADYNALRHPVSGLALGPGGWVQTANFPTSSRSRPSSGCPPPRWPTRWFHRTGDRGWTVYSIGTAAVMLISVGLASTAFAQVPTLVSVGGLFQRASVSTGFAWLTTLTSRALRHRASASRHAAA